MSKKTVKLTSNVTSVATNEFAKLTFEFSSVPVGFTLDDIKVTNGVVTELKQDASNPLIYTALFTPGNTSSKMSTIQLAGDYTTGSDIGNPSNTLTLSNIHNVIVPTIGFNSNNTTVTEGNNGHKTVSYTVTLSAAVSNAVTVEYTTNKLQGNATAGSDFIGKTGTLTFAPGETSKTITVDIIGDTQYEGKEHFYVHLSSASGAALVKDGAEGLRSSWTMTQINNDDAAPAPVVGFASNNASIVEGNNGVKKFNFVATLDKASTEAVTVGYTTNQLKGTATAGSDFVAQTGTVTFAAGETSKTISIDVIGDTVNEGKEYFYLHLTSATGGTLPVSGASGSLSSWVMGNIVDDDVSTVPTVGFSTNNFSMTEGNTGTKKFDFVATLNKASTESVTVGYTTNQLKGTATAGSDFVAQTGTVTFAPGETSKTISVDVIGDTTYEAKEYFYVHLTSVNGAALVVNGSEGLRSNWARGNIDNDDKLGSVGPNSVYGTFGKDVLGGTAHADVIDGMGGQDLMKGYAGADLFMLSSAYAVQSPNLAVTISDFKNGEDRIGLKGGLSFNNLKIEQGVKDHINDTMIYLNTGESLAVLVGVNVAEINANDFSIV